MRRASALAALLVLLAACSSSGAGARPTVVAEVRLAGQAPAITHGNDPLPPRPPGAAAVALEVPWPCEGTGVDGRRVQLLYVHGPGGDLASLRPSIEAWTRQVEGIFLGSARETGGERLLRFVTDAGCRLSILDAVVSANALGSFDAMIDELRASNLVDDNRIYHAFVDSSAYCGIGTVYNDDRATDNENDAVVQYSRSDRPCWNAETEAHELTHNLGGVQNSAPNATGGLHCRDEHDVMCYPDGAPRGQTVIVCPDPAGEDRLDCRHDDYFSTAPAGYLSTHWNVADSSALDRALPATTSSTEPPPTSSSTTLPPTTTTVGKGKTYTVIGLPAPIHAGQPFQAVIIVNGDCRPTGTVGLFVSGKLVSRQALANGRAEVTLTMGPAGSRPTFRADYSGDAACATSRDTYRKRIGP